MAEVLERMRTITQEAWLAVKAAGATWDAGRLVLPLERASHRWATDQEWASGILREWTFDLPEGRTLRAVDTVDRGWRVSLA